jgi:endoglycosylceramidase
VPHSLVLMRLALICCVCVRLSLASLPSLQVGPPRQLATRAKSHSGRRAIVDAMGREYVLRGVNIGLEWWGDAGRPFDPQLYAEGRCPANLEVPSPRRWQWKQPPVCGVDAGKGKWAADDSDLGQNDLAQIRAAGFNVVRLAVSWSLIEPEPGEYSQAYLERIEQVVRWAREQDVWVIIDFHQDSYSYFTSDDNNEQGANLDGAPAWACPVASAYSDDSIISQFDRTVAAKALGRPIPRGWVAFEWFWQNQIPQRAPGTPVSLPSGASTARVAGLQEHYIKAMAAVVKRFRSDSTVLGYEIMNEVSSDIH